MLHTRGKYLVLTLGAVMSACSFMVPALFVLVLVGFTPYMYYVFKDVASFKKLVKDTVYFFGVFHLLSLVWILELYPLEFLGFNHFSGLIVLGGWVVIAGWLTLQMLLLSVLLYVFPCRGVQRVCLVGAAWYVIEVLGQMGALAFPWFPLALPLANVPLLVQSVRYIGSIGLSVLVIACNACLAELWLEHHSGIGRYRLITVVLGSILVCMLAPNIVAQPFPGKSIKVGIVQGNISSKEKWTESGAANSYDIYASLTKTLPSTTELIIWPETALPYAIQEDTSLRENFEQSVFDNGVWIVGAFDERNHMRYNALFAFEDGLVDIYHKRHLVPFGEYIPSFMTTLLPFLAEFQMADEISQGEEILPLHTKQGVYGGLICFESIFPGLSKEAVQNGAQALIVASNDAWYNTTSQIHEHLLHSVLRAVESGRYVVRAANTGISAIIAPSGKFIAVSEEEAYQTLTGDIQLLEGMTFYHRYPYLLLILAGAVFIMCLPQRRKGILTQMRNSIKCILYR